MVFDIIPLIILFASASVICIIVWRRLPYIAGLQVEEIPEHQQATTKQTILENRLRRRLRKVSHYLVGRLGRPLHHLFLKHVFDSWSKVVKREEAWRFNLFRKSHPRAQAEQLAEGIKLARALLEQGNLVDAEKKILLLIRLAPRRSEMYRLLCEAYELQKNWRDAAEALQYALKEEPGREEDYLHLGGLYRQIGDHKRALAMFEKAYVLDPKDPKNLDFLCEESILEGNLQLAQKALTALKEVNPENQKIAVFQDRLKSLKKS